MKNKKVFTTVSISLLLFIAIALSAISFYATVNTELEKSVRVNLSDMADQQQIALDRQLENMVFNLRSIAQTLTIIGVNEDEILEYVYEQQEILNYETVILAQTDGIAYLSTRELIDVSELDFFKAGMAGEEYASVLHISQSTGNEVITVAVPIFVDGVVDGVLAVEYNTEYLTSLLTTFTDARGLSIVVDENSNIIFSTNKAVLSFDAFKNANFSEGNTFETVVDDFKAGSSGSISYTMNDVKKYGEYRPISINGWTLFFEISEEAVSESARLISNRMILISLLLVLTSFGMILYILISKNNAAKALEKVAYYDDLTGAPNLVKFKMVVAEHIKNNPQKRYTMVKMDTINFKAVNDMYGFEQGNRVICAIAETGKKVDGNDFIQARVSAEEFMLFAASEHFDDLEEKSKLYEEKFKLLIPELEDYQFSFRYGRYFLKPGEVDVEEIVHKTNIAHSFAKRDNRSNIWDYDEDFTKRIVRETEISNKMHKAVENEEFKVFIQPKYGILSEKIEGAEALVRWIEADGKAIYPNDFIPLFEQNGFIVELDKYMLRQVCKVLKSWKDENKKCVPISVNFSRLHLRYANFAKEIKEIVLSYGVDPKYIEVELTESAVLENEEELKILLNELQEAGFKASIDDFGSGYSSLGMLKNFKVDTLKLDRSFFVQANSEDEYDRGDLVVDSVVNLAKKLGMYTVAEGIEEKEQVEFLKKIECDAAQGYYFAKPMTVSDFENLFFNE